MLRTNSDNIFTTGRRPTSITDKSVAFMTKLEVEAMLKKQRASASMIGLDLKLPYQAEVAGKSDMI